MTLVLREDDVRALLPMDKAIELTEQVLRLKGQGMAENIPRKRIRLEGGMFHVMSASVPSQNAVGLKAYTSVRGRTTFVVLLFDTRDSHLKAVIEADWLGRIRTGAASGVATKALMRQGARWAGVIGTGGQAETQVEALASVGVQEIRVHSRDPHRREDFARRMSDELGMSVTAARSAEELVESSDIITTITTSREPVFDGMRLRPGTHVNAAGSNVPQRQEIDVATVERAGKVVVDSVEQAQAEAGDLIAANRAGQLEWDRVVELGDILAGQVPGRTAEDAITLYESQGVALEDVMVGQYVYERAVREGRGEKAAFGGGDR